jgi:hypothetical protein
LNTGPARNALGLFTTCSSTNVSGAPGRFPRDFQGLAEACIAIKVPANACLNGSGNASGCNWGYLRIGERGTVVKPQAPISAIAAMTGVSRRLSQVRRGVHPRLIGQKTGSSPRRVVASWWSASNETVGNITASLRSLADVDYPEFFDSVSLVDGVLRSD